MKRREQDRKAEQMIRKLGRPLGTAQHSVSRKMGESWQDGSGMKALATKYGNLSSVPQDPDGRREPVLQVSTAIRLKSMQPLKSKFKIFQG